MASRYQGRVGRRFIALDKQSSKSTDPYQNIPESILPFTEHKPLRGTLVHLGTTSSPERSSPTQIEGTVLALMRYDPFNLLQPRWLRTKIVRAMRKEGWFESARLFYESSGAYSLMQAHPDPNAYPCTKDI